MLFPGPRPQLLNVGGCVLRTINAPDIRRESSKQTTLHDFSTNFAFQVFNQVAKSTIFNPIYRRCHPNSMPFNVLQYAFRLSCRYCDHHPPRRRGPVSVMCSWYCSRNQRELVLLASQGNHVQQLSWSWLLSQGHKHGRCLWRMFYSQV